MRNPGDVFRQAGKKISAVLEWARGHLARLQAARDWARKKGKDSAQARLQRKINWLRAHRDPTPNPQTSELVTFDGHTVPKWMVNEALQPARDSGVWTGTVFSGYRSPEYSTSLCEAMCGAPTCPGRCAGASSNHSCPPSHTGVPYEGAVDVTDPIGLQRWSQAHGYPIKHTLVNDAAHFSRTGG